MAAVALPVSSDPAMLRTEIPAYGATLVATLTIPADASGIVILPNAGDSTSLTVPDATGSALHQLGYGTIFVDLLTADERRLDGRMLLLSLDLPFLAKRLEHVATWLAEQHETRATPIGLVGTGRASGAVLHVAARRPAWLGAVVAGEDLSDVDPGLLARIVVPTRLLARRSDAADTERGRVAQRALRCCRELVLIEDQRCSDAESTDKDRDRTLQWLDQCLRNAEDVAQVAAPPRADLTPVVSSRRRSSRSSWRCSARTASAS